MTAEQALEQAAAEMTATVIEMPTEIERRISILQRDVLFQQERQETAHAGLKAELADIKAERAALREKENAARLRYAEIAEITDRLGNASVAALKELGDA
jgi:hypothetical protein